MKNSDQMQEVAVQHLIAFAQYLAKEYYKDSTAALVAAAASRLNVDLVPCATCVSLARTVMMDQTGQA